MAEFNVTISDLVGKANTLNELNQTFRGQISSMTDLECGLNGMWEGEARNAFHIAFNNDVLQMDNFHKAITIYVETLLASAERYQKAELINIEIGKTRQY